LLHHPYGTSLLGQTMNPFNGFVGIVLLRFMPLVEAFDLMLGRELRALPRRLHAFRAQLRLMGACRTTDRVGSIDRCHPATPSGAEQRRRVG